jgi:hypothetical protein
MVPSEVAIKVSKASKTAQIAGKNFIDFVHQFQGHYRQAEQNFRNGFTEGHRQGYTHGLFVGGLFIGGLGFQFGRYWPVNVVK